MRCPKCGKEGFQAYGTCERCSFAGTPRQIEELSHIAYLLGEIDTWHDVSPAARARLRNRYVRREQELEAALGLRQPALSPQEIRTLQWELYRLANLEVWLDRWFKRAWMSREAVGRLRRQLAARSQERRDRLAAAGPDAARAVPAFDSHEDRLRVLAYVEHVMGRAREAGYFASRESYRAAQADLEVEIQASLHPAAPETAIETAPAARPAQPASSPARSRRPPRQPLTWDRIWQTLLSERTLNVLLFLGALLLVASATTYVIYNWESLPPGAQLAFIVLFTLSFYGAGWYLRVRMQLRASGIAVTAIGSLLVPLDFYAVFVAGGALPAERWPWVWLAASLVCLPVYALTGLRIRAPFFGYLVAAAAGSLLCAALRVARVPDEWWLAGLAALALGVLALA
ncbi:MAG TPA: hypothetical protein VLC52_05320, partial [Anaerolineae bacterium]|nr:hypothetical protein [Anaerolineae bacterium]